MWLRRHKRLPQDFTRDRKLPHKAVLQLLLKKSVKSLQLVLNEWTDKLDYQITASALSQARHKLSHTAFIELHESCVLDVMYRDDYETYKGHRLLGLDGTTLRLPSSKETKKEFGVIEYLNGERVRVSNQVEAKASILYDLLNEVAISAKLNPGRTNDLKAAKENLSSLESGDIVVADRAYGSYRFFNEIINKNANFVIRLKGKTFEKYHLLHGEGNKKDNTVEIPRPTSINSQDNTICGSLKLRFVRIELSSGETEILVTNLIDRSKYTYSDLSMIYHKRWGIETYFHLLKSRLSVDNFTGKSSEAVYQDFYSCIFISGLETIISLEAKEELQNKKTLHPQKVNKVIAFHTIKHKIVEMIFNKDPKIIEKTKEIFLAYPTLIRTARNKEKQRHATSSYKNKNSLHFQKFARKQVF